MYISIDDKPIRPIKSEMGRVYVEYLEFITELINSYKGKYFIDKYKNKTSFEIITYDGEYIFEFIVYKVTEYENEASLRITKLTKL